MTIKIGLNTVDTAKPAILYSNFFETGTITSVGGGNPENAILEDTTFDFWTPGTGTASVTVDMGAATSCDMIGIAAHNLGSKGATVTVQSSADNVAFVNRLVITPSNDSTIIGLFPLISARYWRVEITGGTGRAIGVLKIGRRLIIPGGVLSGHVGINHANEITLLNNMSIRGHFLGNRLIKIGAETEINFGLLEADFVDGEFSGFEKHYNEGRAFFYAGNPANLPNDIAYCWRPENSGTIMPPYEHGGNLMPVQFRIAAYVE